MCKVYFISKWSEYGINLFQKMSDPVNFDCQEINNSFDIDSRLIGDLFYNIQDQEEGYIVQHEENKAPEVKKRKTLKNKPNKKIPKKSEILNNLSYVSRKGKENGHHLIKITIYELLPGVKRSDVDDNVCLSAQYIVEDKYDEILDYTETVVKKIVKKISDSDSYKL